MAEGANLAPALMAEVAKPTLGDAAIGVLSFGTEMVVADAVVGAVVGYLVAPKGEKVPYAVGGGLAVGAAGTFGLVGLLVYRFAVGK